MAVDTLGSLLALPVTPANEQDRARVKALAAQVQSATGETVQVVFGDQGYTGTQPARDAAQAGITLAVVKLPAAKKGFVLLTRRWVVERSFGLFFRQASRPQFFDESIRVKGAHRYSSVGSTAASIGAII